MSKWILSGGAIACFALVVGGCTIETCEQGAVCDKGDALPDGAEIGGDSNVSTHGQSQTDQCLNYCDRLSVCGAPQANDFDACVKACKVRFEKLPEPTANLCACIPNSRCEDVIEGRCSDDSGGGGTSGSGGGGGSSGKGGSHSTGGASSDGGSSASAGTATIGTHSSSGGAPATGGSSTGGGGSGSGAAPAQGGSCGAMSGTAGDASGGVPSEAGGVGAGGESSAVACTCDCDCPEPETCQYGYCAG